MYKLIAAVLVIGVLSLGSGCDRQPAAGGRAGGASTGVAVVDLDRVAQSVGWSEEISRNVKAINDDLAGQLSALRQGFQTSLKEAEDKIGKTPTQEQKDELARMAANANNQLRAATFRAEQDLRQRQAQLILNYREQIRPAARRIADARGLSIIIIPMDYLLYYEPSIDITNAVIDELQKNPPPKPPVPPTPVPPTTQPLR